MGKTDIGRRSPWWALALLGILLTPVEGLTQSSDNIWSNLEDVRAYLGEADFSGVVLIGRGDEVVFEEAYGLAEAELGVRMRPDHRLRIGSLTKPITASAVVIAIDRGFLSPDTNICSLLSSCPRSWEPVTVRHLLTHSSGIVDHFGDLEAVPVEATAEELNRVLDVLPPDEPLRSDPGEEYAYSNFNYILLGAMLEEVVGEPWDTILREWIFKPLGLSSMAYDDVYAIMEGRVRGYERNDTSGLRNIVYDDHAAYAAGGLLSSAGDLFRWSRGMLSGHLFGAELVEESISPHKGDYAYGWQVRRFFDHPIYNHSGGIDGFSSHLAHYPDHGLTIVVLSNVGNDSAILRACDLAGRLFAWPILSSPTEQLTPRQRCGLEK